MVRPTRMLRACDMVPMLHTSSILSDYWPYVIFTLLQNHEEMYTAQSRQSARLSLQSSELGQPTPSPTSDCCPPLFPGGTHSLAGEADPIRTRGHTL
jgi:hypothetical protein